ncbi:MAG: metallophosphoesterase [Chloroflexota bacterium]|jgi:Icc protein|nr:metallophosphoesterase [Chloroflexota bacterium]
MIRLLQFTDTHLLADPAGQVRGVRTLASLEACLAHARRRHLPADLVAVTGDLVQDDPRAYGTLELLFDDLGAPVLLVPGNHDVPGELERRLSHLPFQVGGTRIAGPWTIILLDTWFAESNDGEGRLGPEALEAFDDALRANRDRHVLVLMHHPPIPMEAPGLDALGLLDARQAMDVLARHPQVRGVAWGHAHQSLDVLRGSTRYMCTPSTCMQFQPRVAGFVTDDRPPGYRVLDLHDDGGIATEVVWLEGYSQ